MNRRHFLKALVVVAGAVSLAPHLAIATTLEEATRPYVIRAPAWPISELAMPPLTEYGQYIKVSDLSVVPAPLRSDDPLAQYGIQGWKTVFVSKIIEPQHRAAVLANLTRPLPVRRLPRAAF